MSTQRFENKEQFWAVSRNGTAVHVSWGTSGAEKTKDVSFATVVLATREVEKLIATVRKLGFTPVAAPRNVELEAAVLRGGGGPAFEVYSDWLAAQGDARGELGALVVRKPALVEAFVEQHLVELFGDFAPLFASGALSVGSWRPGFVRRLSVGAEGAEHLISVLALPVMPFVDELVLSLPGDAWRGALAQVEKTPQGPRLRTLELECGEDNEWSEEPFELGRALTRYRRLEELSVEFGSALIKVGQLPEQLRALRLVCFELTNLTSLAKRPLPKLERLELHYEQAEDFDEAEDGGPVGADEVVETFVTHHDTLSSLTISGVDFSEELLEVVFESECFSRLTTLDLADSRFAPGAFGVVANHLDTLRGLERLGLPGDSSDWEELGLDVRPFDEEDDEADAEED